MQRRVDGRLVLAEGEATGHAHAVLDEHARLEVQHFGESRAVWLNRRVGTSRGRCCRRGRRRRRWCTRSTTPLTVPPGGYLVRRQREYVPPAAPAAAGSAAGDGWPTDGHAIDEHSAAARSSAVRAARPSGCRVDRARAEAAIRRLWRDRPRRSCGRAGSRTAWSSSRDDQRRVPFTFRQSGAHAAAQRLDAWRSSQRIRDVAGLDEAVLTAARHAATARLPRDERLAFRTSIPGAPLVSALAAEALDPAQLAGRSDATSSRSGVVGGGCAWRCGFSTSGRGRRRAATGSHGRGRRASCARPAGGALAEGEPVVLAGGVDPRVACDAARRLGLATCSPSATSSGAGSWST